MTRDPAMRALAVAVRQSLLMICAAIEKTFGLRPKASNRITINVEGDGTDLPVWPEPDGEDLPTQT